MRRSLALKEHLVGPADGSLKSLDQNVAGTHADLTLSELNALPVHEIDASRLHKSLLLI
jgi:hypothetical protein